MSKLNFNYVNALINESSFKDEEYGVIYSSQDWEECCSIEHQYERAISRTSTYHCQSLADHVYSGHGLVYKYKSSYLVGNYYCEEAFVLSHFAPKSLKEGMEMMEFVSYKETIPMVLAVPHRQAKMAIKCGWDLVGLTQQIFGGEMVQKVVLCNRALSNDKYWALYEKLQFEAALRKPKLP